jgi:quinohemoprotein ethanol dehydrogenase
MSKRQLCVWACLPVLFALVSCSRTAATLDDAALRAADQDSANWLMYGRTYDDHRFSPLGQINEQTVGKLGLAWSREMNTTRGLEASPLVEDGVIYTTGAWSVVDALDAKTGDVRWTYDPKVPRENAYFVCCEVVNRGAALYRGKVYVATLDGRLIALDQKTGAPVWTAATTNNKAYTITSAPRIAKGLVVIGNAGSEYGVRGYVSAYDAETGKLAWRTYTVPGDPAKGFESKAMEAAAKTWKDDYWKTGGGGTPWEGAAYDPDLDLVYLGTGNATAWYRALRGGGDSLYTASILAVHANNGELAWYFQTTPSDNWDYDATQPLMQADLTIGGRARKVIMQANKNGFFYVLDRQTGEFISGAPFVSGVSWATGLDPKTGRPIEAPGVATMKPELISPGPDGAHNWHPMAFSPATGLVYLSAKSGEQFIHAPDAKWKYNPETSNLGLDPFYDGPLNAKLVTMPPSHGELLAWDPVKQQAAWRAPSPTASNGGVLATAGNLVFEGRADGMFTAYRATDGKQLWQFDAGTGIVAPPVTYSVDGTQYVSVMAGWGGSPALFNTPGSGPVKPGYGRILTFTIGGTATLNPPAFGHKDPPPMPTLKVSASPQMVREGGLLFNNHCGGCHGINAVAGPLPDLRYSDASTLEGIDSIVLGGERASLGMPSFQKILNQAQVREIQAYIVSRARESAKPAANQRH